MTIASQVRPTPQGKEILYVAVSGRVEGREVDDLMVSLAPKGAHHGKFLLVALEKGTELTPEARTGFSAGFKPGGRVGQVPSAVVVPSTPLRVLISFLSKVTGTADVVRICSTDAEAYQWLDGKLLAARGG